CMDPCVMDARTCLAMATIEGAKAIGLDRKIGSIERGKQADIIIVDVKKPHMVPMYEPFSSLVYSAKSSDVSLVMVDGILRVKEGELL
ncbi:MAG: amidohydrolase family protein, partial [Desulfobacterales bacterium]|nr:amidohydrolase family protein [Desulfobacterales bacterium]